jgi:hypothetical protein
LGEDDKREDTPSDPESLGEEDDEEDTPFKRESSGEDDEDEDEDGEEGKVSPPPDCPSCEALPLPDDIFSRQMGIAVSTRQPKRPQAETGQSTGSLPQPCLALVSSDLQGTSVVPMLMRTTHLFMVS